MNKDQLTDELQFRRIAVIRALKGLGDILCAVPTFRALRAAFPQAEITLVGLSAIKPVLERFSTYVDDLLEFPGYPGLIEQTVDPVRTLAFFTEAQSRNFDLAIQMHGSGGIMNPVTVMLGARYNAGFYQPGQYCPDETRFLPYPETESEVRRYLQLLEFIGIPAQGEYLEFPLNAEDFAEFSALPEAAELHPGEYVCIHPGASVPARRWQPEGFARVADKLARQGLQVVLTGSAEESVLTQAVSRKMKAPSINLAGRTTLGAMAVLLKNSRLLVCNDTGVSHLADALQVPSTVIFTGADPGRWGPLDRNLHRIVYKAVECSPCEYPVCPIDHRCATRVTSEMVLGEVKPLLQLQKEKVYAA